MGMIEFGMPTLIELNTLEETCKLCKNLGLKFIELNMNLPDYQIEQLENTSELLRLQDKYQLMFTIHLDENLNVCDFNKAVTKAYSDTVRRTIEVAKVIHAPILNMHMNHGVHFTLPDRKVQLFEKYNRNYMDSWKSFRNMCENAIGDADIKLCIENTDGFTDYEKKSIEYLLKSDVFALTWDIGHSNAVDDIDEPFLMQNERKLTHFHIHDGLGTEAHLTLGNGEIDLKQRLALAAEQNCRCVVETKTVEALTNSVNWLDKYRMVE